MSTGDDSSIDRRRPAHPAPLERFNQPVIVQVNVCTKNRRRVLACQDGHRLCREIWLAADYWRVGHYVIMPDHIHLFCAPGRIPMPRLRQWVEFWKSRIASLWPVDEDRDDTEVVPPVRPGSAHGGTGSVPSDHGHDQDRDDTEVVPPGTSDSSSPGSHPKLWQRDFWDTQMRSKEHYEEKLFYVRMNPVRKNFVTHWMDWPYQGTIHPIEWR